METGGNPIFQLWGFLLRPAKAAELGKQVLIEKFERAAAEFFGQKYCVFELGLSLSLSLSLFLSLLLSLSSSPCVSLCALVAFRPFNLDLPSWPGSPFSLCVVYVASHIFVLVWVTSKLVGWPRQIMLCGEARQRGDSSPCGQSPMDF